MTPELSEAASVPGDVVVRRMIALFDYDPWESSPNIDTEVSTAKPEPSLHVLHVFTSTAF